jgi:hypothetical protein
MLLLLTFVCAYATALLPTKVELFNSVFEKNTDAMKLLLEQGADTNASHCANACKP